MTQLTVIAVPCTLPDCIRCDNGDGQCAKCKAGHTLIKGECKGEFDGIFLYITDLERFDHEETAMLQRYIQ